ncbi:MAG TPA: ABC transporter ATP-binding protein [Phycisphaerae bacterium]|nr:ABC transporter ATP-binding protein [Phycisphaerae bacterium]
MVEARNIRKEYPSAAGDLSVLTDVSLALRPGESAAIMGPSGCGKSTFLNILGTLETPTWGSVRIDDCDPFSLNEPALAKFRNKSIGFIFQDHHLLPQCSVLENVLVPTLVQADADAPARARALIDRVGLSARLDHRPAELSGGERQRVAIARALVNQPAVLLADEPTGDLDAQTADTIAALLLEIHRERKTVLVVVTHSSDLARRFDRRFQLREGRLQPVQPA